MFTCPRCGLTGDPPSCDHFAQPWSIERIAEVHGQIMTNRDKSSGRYVDTKFDKLCICGHTLGIHTADRKGNIQPCFAKDCECECFKKAHKNK